MIERERRIRGSTGERAVLHDTRKRGSNTTKYRQRDSK
jgi:hypothetical protein